MDPMTVAGGSAAAVALFAYFLRQKDMKFLRLEERVSQLELDHARTQEGNKNRDEKLDNLDAKMDRILDKLGA